MSPYRESRTLASVLKTMASLSMDKGGDTFSLIYEYFVGKFAMSDDMLQGSVDRFDFVLAKPPFNVSKIDKEHLA